MVKKMNNCNNEFEEYYYQYLDYNGNENIVCSKNRERKVNIFYYPIIISFYKNKIIYSISSNYYDELKEYMNNKAFKDRYEIINFFKDYFERKNEKILIQEMKRMIKNKKSDIDISRVVKIDEKYKKEYFNSFEKHSELEYKEKKWNIVNKYMYVSGVVKDNKIVSSGFVSNIDYNGANIVIQTKEKYRKNGYGKSVVEKISRDLLKEHKIPIYWVNIENKASIQLAKKLDFEELAKELVVKLI